jgi:hypothetical protein
MQSINTARIVPMINQGGKLLHFGWNGGVARAALLHM